jgi:hypothetical protein
VLKVRSSGFWDGGRYSSLFVAHTATSQGSRSRALFICVNHLISLVVQFKHVETTIDDDGTNPNVDFVFSNAPPGSPYRKGHFLAQKCSLINFGDETIFDIPIVINVSFTRVSDKRGGIKNVVAKGRSPECTR